jgi:hypothetical protein
MQKEKFMKFKKTIAAMLTLITSFTLCSFTSSNESADGGEDEFAQNINELSPNLDKEYLYGNEDLGVENELSDDDIGIIKEFVSFDESHIELDNAVYEILPVNDLRISPSEYFEASGQEEPLDNGVTEYSTNQKKLSYVEDNVSLMNFMTENDYGRINSDGEMEFLDDDFIQQSFIMNFKLSWFKMTFRTNYWGSIIFGAFGLLINNDLIKDVNNLFNADASQFEECFKDVASGLILDGASYFGNLMISSLASAVNTTMTIKNIVMQTTWIGRLIKIVKYILSHYAPGLLRGIVMILSGVIYQYGTDVEIGLWWSNYTVLSYRTY